MRNRLAIIFLLLLVLGCLPKDTEIVEEVVKKDSMEVTATLVALKEIPFSHYTTGGIAAANNLKIVAPTGGTLEKVLVQEGQKIIAGSTVAVYLKEDLKTKLDLASAEEEEAQAAIDYEQYRMDHKDELLDAEEISKIVYDMIPKKLALEKARLKRARAEAEHFKKASGHSDIVSSISGTVVKNLVTDQTAVTEGQLLMEVVQSDPMKLRVRLPEEFIPATHRGQLIQLKYSRIDRKPETVKIDEVGLAVDPLTRTFEITANLDNSKGELKEGMSADVAFVTDRKRSVITIPQSCVTLRDKKPIIFKVENGIARQTTIKLGNTIGKEVLVQGGVKEGEIVITNPPRNINDGDSVVILTTGAKPPVS